MSSQQRIEEQYPLDKYLSVNRTGVTFTEPSATLRYDLEPVAGWFITTQGDTTRKVRIFFSKPSTSLALLYIADHRKRHRLPAADIKASVRECSDW